MDIASLTDGELVQLINNRWASSATVWSVVDKVYKRNTQLYDLAFDEKDKERMPDYIRKIPSRSTKVRSNRIFANTEAVINSLIATLPKPNILPGRQTPQSIQLAQLQEQYFINKYTERNVKETMRKGLRNLYFGRLIVVKPFWNAKINDFDAIALDPRKVRVGKFSTKEIESEFVIEEVTDSLEGVVNRFPAKADKIMARSGYKDMKMAGIMNPEITYKEAWIKDRVIFQYQDIILGNIRNPYWDWDGLLITSQEEIELAQLAGDDRKAKLQDIRGQQEQRVMSQQPPQQSDPSAQPQPGQQPDVQQMMQQMGAQPVQQGQQPANDNQQQPQPISNLQELQQNPQSEPYLQTVNQTQAQSYQAYLFNHFDQPRKPYIYATILNNENSPIGRTDFISEAWPLQESVDRRKRQMDENAELMNGIIKVDSSVMSKADAQRLRYETTGIFYGKGVVNGVKREVGQPLPEFIFNDMQDSRNEIDNIMAASSAFRGEREGQETKGGRLALIEQSALRLNELVQVVDYVNYELFNWFYQLAKVRYTETHYAKTMGQDNAMQIMQLQQDDFEDGTEIRIIPGKTLPEDKQFKYQQAADDVARGVISPVDYLKAAGYDNPLMAAKNAEVYKLNPPIAVGISPEELQQLAPPQPPKELPREMINFKDLPPEGQAQLAQQAGIQLDPNQIALHQAVQAAQKRLHKEPVNPPLPTETPQQQMQPQPQQQ